MSDAALDRYRRESFEFPGPDGNAIRHDVYHRDRPGSAAVIVLHELFGLSPPAIELGDYLADSFTVYLPVLFGRPGESGVANAVRAFCVRREFHFFVTARTSPVTTWVRALARMAAERAGGRPVGVVGMCLTGGIVFSAIAEPDVGAGVAAQPSLPLSLLGPLTPSRVRRDLGTSPDDLMEAAASDTDLMMLRYRDDRTCPAARLESAAAVFGGVGEAQPDPADASVSVAEGSQLTTLEVAGKRHSVLAADLNVRSRDIVKDFLERHLGSV